MIHSLLPRMAKSLLEANPFPIPPCPQCSMEVAGIYCPLLPAQGLCPLDPAMRIHPLPSPPSPPRLQPAVGALLAHLLLEDPRTRVILFRQCLYAPQATTSPPIPSPAGVRLSPSHGLYCLTSAAVGWARRFRKAPGCRGRSYQRPLQALSQAAEDLALMGLRAPDILCSPLVNLSVVDT